MMRLSKRAVLWSTRLSSSVNTRSITGHNIGPLANVRFGPRR